MQVSSSIISNARSYHQRSRLFNWVLTTSQIVPLLFRVEDTASLISTTNVKLWFWQQNSRTIVLFLLGPSSFWITFNPEKTVVCLDHVHKCLLSLLARASTCIFGCHSELFMGADFWTSWVKTGMILSWKSLFGQWCQRARISSNIWSNNDFQLSLFCPEMSPD